MTLPAAIARLNRIGINRLTRRMAGRVPPFALIEHTGRRSGTRYQTPIMVQWRAAPEKLRVVNVTLTRFL